MKEKLNSFHIALLIYMTETTVNLLSLPRLVAENIGTNGWLGYIFLSMIAALNILLYRVVYQKGNGASIFQILETAFPKGILNPFYLILSLFWITTAAFIGKNFFLVFQLISFQTINIMYIFLLFCFMVFFLLIKNIYSISKANTIFFFMSIWTLFLTVYHFRDWESVRFTTYWFRDAAQGHSLHNWMEVYITFVGYELCLFLFPFVQKESKLFKGVLIGHGLISTVQLIVIITAFGFFSFDQIQSLLYPLIDLLDFIEMSFINRIASLVFVFYLFATLTTTAMFCFASLSTLKQTFPRIQFNHLAFSIVLLMFAFGFLPRNFIQAELWLRRMLFIEVALAFSLPILLILVLQLLKVRRKRLRQD